MTNPAWDQLLAWQTHDNFGAAVAVIAEGESSNDDSAWTVIYGGQHFTGFDDHPRIFIPLPDGQKSSAAGKLQITATTWDDFCGHYGKRPFTPENQLTCGAWLIWRAGAMDDVLAGRIDAAIRKLSKVWTSLAIPRRQQEAPQIFAAYGGKEAGVPVTSVAQTKEVKPMPAILAAILPALFSAAPDLIRLLGTAGSAMTERNAVIAQKVADVAVQVTGAVNEQAAADTIANDPQAAARFRDAVAQNFDQWLGMVVKFNEMSEASKEKAREFVLNYDRAPVLWRFTFLELLSLIFVIVSASGAGWVLYAPDFSMELKGAVIAAVLIGGFTGVKEAWFGKDMGQAPGQAPK